MGELELPFTERLSVILRSYWMNRLQGLLMMPNFFVSLNLDDINQISSENVQL